jgi:imidazole glycerol-phosphate synthase subunit HisH
MIAVIDYGAGNTFNVMYALQQLGTNPILTNDAKTLLEADKIIFPGVGHATHALEQLERANVLQHIPTLQQPVLGICLGMQLLFNSSQETNLNALQIINAPVNRFSITKPTPHMGWNNVTNKKHVLFDGIENEDFYFVHNYYGAINEDCIATCNYEIDFCAAVQHSNFYGTQFHPEKSGKAGLKLLQNFLAIN